MLAGTPEEITVRNGRFLAALLLLGSLHLGAFADTSDAQPSSKMLAGLTPEATLKLANEWGMKSDENKTTIWTNPRAFNFQFADGSKTVIAMPDDRMAVSIVPYIMKTHPCSGHYPSTCRGELANTPVHVKAVTSDGRTLLDEDTTTLPNGSPTCGFPAISRSTYLSYLFHTFFTAPAYTLIARAKAQEAMMLERSASRRRLGAIGLMLALATVPLSYAGGQPEQTRNYAPGMMGGGQGGAYGPGMMGGGMMGGSFFGLDNSLQRTVDIKKAQAIVTDYLGSLSNKNLVIDEIMEFENNLYVLIKESDTGKGAFELLVDPFTGAVRPEFGPNMMWNLKYGMMGGRTGSVRANAIGMEEAKKLASEYLDRVRGHGPYDLAADEFYGYYTLDVRKDGTVLGMLSVNAFSGQVWYHTWHGGYIGMQEGVEKM